MRISIIERVTSKDPQKSGVSKWHGVKRSIYQSESRITAACPSVLR